jgi:phosphoribosylformylglycinamidine synthase II
VGDPFEEKRLIEACLQLLDEHLVVGIQDLGGAGITCATSETASRGGVGMDVDVAAIPTRELGMEPFEIMTSESQERMLAIVEPSGLERVLAICDRWEVRASVIGVVTEGGRLRIRDGFDGEVLADVPASSLHDAAPLYDRPRQAPAPSTAPGPESLAAPADAGTDLVGMLTDTAWVSSQYDHQLFLNTVVGPGGDATVLRLKHPISGHDTGRALAITVDGNHRWCAVDPRRGTALTLAESVLNLACVGARPLAVVNCLNFGNPENPEVMWQLSEAIDGMADACRAFGVPVIGGNVSLYNESAGVSIDPTPVIGLLGLVDDLTAVPPGVRLTEGHRILVLGPETANLAGSRWAADRGARGGSLDPLSYEVHTAVADLTRALVTGGLVSGVHDVSVGGLGVALAEMAVASGVGFSVARVADHRALFAEGPSRVVVVVAPEVLANVVAMAEHAGVAAVRLGLATGDRLVVKGLVDVALADATTEWRDRLPLALGSGSTH